MDVVGAYLSLRPAGGIFTGLCPFCANGRPSFTVSPARRRCHCCDCEWEGGVALQRNPVTKPRYVTR